MARRSDAAVTHRFTYEVCAGWCIDEAVSVAPDGLVRWAIHDPLTPDHLQEPSPRSRRLRVSARAARAYRRTLLALRPARDTVDRRGCDRPEHARHVFDWDIVWSGAGEQRRLRTCDADGTVGRTWGLALASLGMPHGIAGPFGPGVRCDAPPPRSIRPGPARDAAARPPCWR